MRFCTNCGEALENEAAFCPNCGAQVAKKAAEQSAETVSEEAAQPEQFAAGSVNEITAEPEAPAKKKKAKVGIIIAIVLAALLAAFAGLYFSGALKRALPSSRAKLALAEKDLVEDVLDKYFDEQKRIFGEDGKLDLKADMDVTASLNAEGAGIFSEIGIISALIDQFKLNIGLDMNGEDNNIKLGLNYKNNPVLDGSLLMNKDTVGLYIPQLDSKYYTISMEALTKLLAEEEDTEISADQLIGSLSAEPLDEAKVRKEVLELLAIVGKVSTEANTEIEKEVSLDIFGGAKQITVDKYTVTPSAEEIQNMLNELADYLSKDNCYIAGKLAPLYDAMKDETDPETLEEYLKNNAEYTGEVLAGQNARFIACLAEESEIVSQQFVTDDQEYRYDVEKTEGAERIYVTAKGEEDDSAVADIRLDKANDNKRKGTAKVTISDSPEFDLAFDFDLTSESAIKTNPGTLSVKADGKDLIAIAISPEGEGMMHEISILPDVFELFDMEDSDIKGIVVKANVTEGEAISAPAGIEPTDLSDKSAEEIGEIFESMIGQLSSVISGMFLPF